ncbi:putative RNA methyltransferase [Nocardia stercoris]|uniref:putative RNA methyltransferase n=1 Tax=Nocardia stercoris TaxID=2483361 RepID=UPI00389945E6
MSCPECGSPLSVWDRALRCPQGHSFDIARQGYVSLLTGAATKMSGDTAEMLDARAAFQAAGHFAPIAAAVGAAIAAPALPASILEVGSGTGYYLGAALDAAPAAAGIALDVAKPAARRAARCHPRAASILADAWRRLPIRDGVLTHVLSVFAPRNPAEVARILDRDGRFVVVTPTVRHLAELIEPLAMVSVDAGKEARLTESLSGHFEPVASSGVEYSMDLTHTDIERVVAMGPSAFHAPADRPARIAALPERVAVTASVTVSIYRPR